MINPHKKAIASSTRSPFGVHLIRISAFIPPNYDFVLHHDRYLLGAPFWVNVLEGNTERSDSLGDGDDWGCGVGNLCADSGDRAVGSGE